jgi:hypothetical protein
MSGNDKTVARPTLDNSMLRSCNTTYNLLNYTQTIQSFPGLGGFLCLCYL